MTGDLWDLVLGGAEPGGPMGRPVHAGHCPACAAPWLYALDSNMCALPARVDPVPLSALGEVQAVIGGLRTYELRRQGGGYQLDWRDSGIIRSRPAGSGAVDVLAEHRCGVVLAAGSLVLQLPCPLPVNSVPPF